MTKKLLRSALAVYIETFIIREYNFCNKAIYLKSKSEMHDVRVILELPKINWHKAGVWISIGGIGEFILGAHLSQEGNVY